MTMEVQEFRAPSRFCLYCGDPIDRKDARKFCSESCSTSSRMRLTTDGRKIEMTFSATWVPELRAEATRRGISPKALVRAILAAVVKDRMYGAVLDE